MQQHAVQEAAYSMNSSAVASSVGGISIPSLKKLE
jgi:hypothetical protein